MSSPPSDVGSPQSSLSSDWSVLEDDELPAITDRLKLLAKEHHSARIPYKNDDSEHYRALDRAISNVLATDLALFTYAQIIDGLPTATVAFDCRSPSIPGSHPIEDHKDLCPGVMDRARSFKENFSLSVLSFDPKTLQSFQEASPRSRRFNTRLIELVAVAMHEIGVLLFQMGLRMHQGDIESIDQWIDKPVAPGLEPVPPRPTMFNHHGYLHADIYPNGVADMVGYWAENRILGGVTVFDRKAEDEGDPDHPPNVYFHSCRRKVTFRYYQLRDDQQQSLIDFLLAENPPADATPLPILADNTNLVRVDEQDAVLRHVYRDVWERKPPTRSYLRLVARMCSSTVDYPEQEAFINYLNTSLGTATVTANPPQHDSRLGLTEEEQNENDGK